MVSYSVRNYLLKIFQTEKARITERLCFSENIFATLLCSYSVKEFFFCIGFVSSRMCGISI